MQRAILHALPWLLLGAAAAADADARSAHARIARVVTPVATLQGVDVRLDWPDGADAGVLALRAARVQAPDLGYDFRDLAWACPVRRDSAGGWRCSGELRAGRAAPLRLSVDLASASTEARLSQGAATLSLHRTAAAPDETRLDLVRVPLAWAQALSRQAWAAGRLSQGTLDGNVTVHAPERPPLRIEAVLALQGATLDTADGSVAAERLGGRFRIDYRGFPAARLLSIDGELRGGAFLYGTAFVALPETPVALRIDAVQRDGDGWRLPTIAWRDGDALAVDGSAGFDRDASLRQASLRLRSRDARALAPRYLSGWLGIAGLPDLDLRGALEAHLQFGDGRLQAADAQLHDMQLRAPGKGLAFDGLDGDVRWSTGAAEEGVLRWRSGALSGIAFGAAQWPLRSEGGVLRTRAAVSVPMLDGRVRFEDFTLSPPSAGAAMQLGFGLVLEDLSLGKLSKTFGGPEFRGTLSGRIPAARYADDRLAFDGGLRMRVFDGDIAVTALSMERPFGVAPTLSADLALHGLDLMAITEVFDFGSISGRLDGRIDRLRLVDWEPEAFDAELHTVPRAGVPQRISQRAVQDISSVGDASFGSSLQGRLIALFEDFGYARIGISCRLVNEVCTMGGLRRDGYPTAGGGFTIVEGAGVPRLDVVGFHREVDWPTLVQRLSAATRGDVKPVFE